MYYGGLQTDKNLRPYRKHYSSDGSMEIKRNITTNAVEIITYIGGDGYSAPIIIKSNGTTQNYFYLHRDYLGSIMVISNAVGQVVEKRHFDAWGNIVFLKDQNNTNLTTFAVIDRGYTGHEHLQGVGLIHMNGRLYDSKVRRFLSPDNYVQDPSNTQNFNRYGYVLNNPLKYTDSSGEIAEIAVAVIIGAGIAALTYTITALTADVPFTAGGLIKSVAIGAFSGTVTFGIGQAATAITELGTRIAFQALTHGVFQGTMTGIQGGDIITGFASGSLSSLASSIWSGGPMKSGKSWSGAGGKFGYTTAGTLAFGTLAGGAGASLTGGNFWQGAATGLIVSGLNHMMHKNKLAQQNDPRISITVTDEIIGETEFKSNGKSYSTPLYKMIVSGTDIDGNIIEEEFAVSRFGVKNGKINPSLKAGSYTVTEFKQMTSGVMGFQIGKTPYFFHKQYGLDTNWGCLTIKGASWNNFLIAIEKLGWDSNLQNTARSGVIKVNVNSAPTPIINWR
jgi:RHS repeat-associated protein